MWYDIIFSRLMFFHILKSIIFWYIVGEVGVYWFREAFQAIPRWWKGWDKVGPYWASSEISGKI